MSEEKVPPGAFAILAKIRLVQADNGRKRYQFAGAAVLSRMTVEEPLPLNYERTVGGKGCYYRKVGTGSNGYRK